MPDEMIKKAKRLHKMCGTRLTARWMRNRGFTLNEALRILLNVGWVRV